MSPAPELKVTLVQPSLFWENKSENLRHFERIISDTSDSDLIVLPEMFTTGFSMNPYELAESFPGPTAEWMKKMANKSNAVITGSVMTKNSDGKFVNRLIWATPDGHLAHYDKRHLFSFADEEQHYTAGKERLVVELKGWRVCPMICYDLRFPIWSRNNDLSGQNVDHVYDLLIYVANWPEARRKPWMNLLEARAHENQSYVVGVNCVGVDGNGIVHSGDSAAFSARGELLSHFKPMEEQVETITLNWADLDQFRQKFTPWKDKDVFKLMD